MYVKIRSWHLVRTATRVPNNYVTVCGRRASGLTVDDFGLEKTCETCLRLAAKTMEGIA